MSQPRCMFRVARCAIWQATTSPVLPTLPARRYKSSGKKSKGKERLRDREEADEMDAPSVSQAESTFGVRIDRKKARQGTITVIEGQQDVRDGEQFDLESMKSRLRRVVEELRVQLKPIMGQINQALETSVVEPLVVDHHALGKVTVPSLASISRASGGSLKITVFDPKDMMVVESTLKAHGMTPSRLGNEANAFLVKPAGFDEHVRRDLLKRALGIIGEAEGKASRARDATHKGLKEDLKNKVINDREARREGKEMDDEARKSVQEISRIRDHVRQLILDK